MPKTDAARTARATEINGAPIDRFTLAHVAVGAVYGMVGLKFPTVAFMAIGWELIERPLKRSAPGVFPNATQDTAPNAILDAGATMAGWYIGRAIQRGRVSWR